MKLYEKHARVMLAPAPCTNALVWSCVMSRSNFRDGPIVKLARPTMYASFSVHFTNTITLHMESDPKQSPMTLWSDYHKRMAKFYRGVVSALQYLNNDFTEDFNWKNWLSVKDGTSFGSSLIIDIPADPKAMCIFEIADCYKKYRSTTTRKDLQKFLRKLCGAIDKHMKELEVMKAKYEETR